MQQEQILIGNLCVALVIWYGPAIAGARSISGAKTDPKESGAYLPNQLFNALIKI